MMKPETKRRKELDRQQRNTIIQESRIIKYQFKRWGFRLNIFPLHPYSGWAKMTQEQIYQPEIYDVWLGKECVAEDLYITDLRKVYLAMKRYKHDYGVKKLRENIKDVLNDKQG